MRDKQNIEVILHVQSRDEDGGDDGVGEKGADEGGMGEAGCCWHGIGFCEERRCTRGAIEGGVL